MLPLLQKQTGVLYRFIKYLKNRVEMANFLKAKSYSSNGTEDVEEDIEDDDDKVRFILFAISKV